MHPTTSEIVARYECENVPDEIFRVQYDDSMSLRARTSPAFQTRREFKKAVERHLIWGNREPTAFVSTFGDRRHANNWAKHRVDKRMSEKAVVLTLKVDRSRPIFRVRDLVKHRGVKTNLPESMYRDEYLVLRRIRHRSILNKKIISSESSSDEESSDDESSSYKSSIEEINLNFDDLQLSS